MEKYDAMEGRLPELSSIENNLTLFHILVNQSNDAIFLADPDAGRFLYVNDKACSDLGYAREELLNMGVPDIETMLPDQAAWKRHIGEIRRKGYAFFEGMHRRKDGAIFPVEMNIKFVSLPGKNYIVAVARDISSRKQAADALKESERQLSEAQRVARLGSWEWNITTNKVTWSEEAYRLFGIDKEEFGARYEAFLKFVHPEDREMLDRAVKKAVAEKEPYNIDARILRPDGSLWIMYARGEVIYDDADKPVLMRGILQDITERKQAEAALRESEEKYRSLVESTDDSIYVVDRECRYLHMNRKHMARMGFPGDEYIGRAFSEFHGEEETRQFAGDVGRVFATGHSMRREYKSGRDNHYFFQTLSPVKRDSGQIAAVTIISKDITERRNMEEKLRTLSFTDELTGLYNRRGFFAHCDQVLKLCRRNKKGAYLLYADLDNLKEINDVFGHSEGDKVLVETATIFKETFRESDIVARIGGDEFVVIPAGDGKDALQRITARLHRNIEHYNEKGESRRRLSVSLGASYYDPHSPRAINKLIAEAETAMYAEKRNKRS